MKRFDNNSQNGNGTGVSSPGSDSTGEGGRWNGENVDILLTMQKGLFDHGRDRAVASGAIEPVEWDIVVLREHAEKMAEETYRRAFDPDDNIDDKLKQAEFDRNQKEREEAILGVKHGKAELSKREDEHARVKAKVSKDPEFPLFTAFFGAAVTALTVAPTLHDTVFASFGNDWAWVLGVITGAVWGAFVAYSILDGRRRSAEKTVLNYLGLIAAVGMAFALGLIRLMNTQDSTDYIVAFAFTLLETFVAIGLEAVAQKYYGELDEYSQKAAEANGAGELAKNAETELLRRQADVGKLSAAIQRYIDYVSERELRSTQKSELIASAIKAVLDGYNDGIEYGRGKILGINR